MCVLCGCLVYVSKYEMCFYDVYLCVGLLTMLCCVCDIVCCFVCGCVCVCGVCVVRVVLLCAYTSHLTFLCFLFVLF